MNRQADIIELKASDIQNVNMRGSQIPNSNGQGFMHKILITFSKNYRNEQGEIRNFELQKEKVKEAADIIHRVKNSKERLALGAMHERAQILERSLREISNFIAEVKIGRKERAETIRILQEEIVKSKDTQTKMLCMNILLSLHQQSNDQLGNASKMIDSIGDILKKQLEQSMQIIAMPDGREIVKCLNS